MSKVFTSDKFIEKLKHIASLPTTYYSVSGGAWASWNGWSWNFDCVILVKALLWGWCEDKNKAHGGAIYLSNGVPDVNADGMIQQCYDVSNDFNNISRGELLWMNGHVGIYIGDRKVIECTAGWEGKVLYSDIGYDGKRSRNGIQIGYWQRHGKLPYIEYINTPSEDKKVNVFAQGYTKENGWLPEVKNNNDYVGYKNNALRYIGIGVDKGSIKYRVTTITGKILPWVTQYNIKDLVNGCAGNGEPIATVEVYYYTPNNIRPYKKAKYKVNDYDWQYDLETSNGQDGYAGAKDVVATKFQIEIV